MTVRELMERLEKMDPSMDVAIEVQSYGMVITRRYASEDHDMELETTGGLATHVDGDGYQVVIIAAGNLIDEEC